MELLEVLKKVPDPRRGQAKQYELHYILLFVVLAMMSNAVDYKGVSTFIQTHFELLKKTFNLDWRYAPCYRGVHDILIKVSAKELEKILRQYRKETENIEGKFIAVDGKTLRGSYDNGNKKKAAHLIEVLAQEECLVLASEEVDEKSNEIPAVQNLLPQLGLTNKVFTLDAMHCQKNSKNNKR